MCDFPSKQVSLDAIVDKFAELGLDEEESKVLTSLYMSGSTGAGAVAKATGISRIKAYRTLKKLQEMNIVESTLGRPVLFSAVPLESAVDNLVEHFSARLKAMISAKQDIVREFSNFKAQPKAQADAKYRIIQGKDQIYSWIARMAGSAKREILAYIEKEDLMRMYYTDIPEKLAQAKKKGISVRVLTEVDYTLMNAVNNYAGTANIRHTKIPGMSVLMVVDESDLIVSAMAKTESESESSVALWMNAGNFVTGIKGLLKDSWGNAIDAQTRMSILRGGGKAYQDILVVKGRDRIAEFYEKITQNKKEVLCISAPHDAKFFDATIKKAAAAFMANGTKLKILTSVDRDSLAGTRELLALGNVRHVESAAGMNILLADDEVLVSPATFQTKNQNAIWSNVRDYVDHYRTIFDNLWASSHAVSGRMQALEQQIHIDELKSEMSGRLENMGFEVQSKIEGISKMAHEFAIVATRKDESVVVDIMGTSSDIQGAIINFVVKCIDVPAKHKMLVALSDLEAIRNIASNNPLGGMIKVVDKKGAEQFLSSLA